MQFLNSNGKLSNNIFLNDPLEQFELQHLMIAYTYNNIMECDIMSRGTLTEKTYFVQEPTAIDYIFDWTGDLLVMLPFGKAAVFLIHGFISPIQIMILWFVCGAICTSILIFDKTERALVYANYDNNYATIQKGFFINFLNKTLLNIVKTILKSNVSLERKEYFSLLYFLFIFILVCNVFGLIPFTFTVTSSFVVTFFLAATHFIAINIIFIYRSGKDFYKIFLPSGVPQFILPFLFIIEIISYIAKVFSLSIRLFANMMSGHALLKILIGFSWTMLSVSGGIFYGLAIFPWIIVTLILFLEILIAFLQAYVFVVLIVIYVNDILSQH